MFILRHKKIFFAFSIILVVVALIGIFSKGFNWGIDFTGGSVIEINYTNTVPTFEQVQATVKTTLPEATVQKIGDTGFLVRTTELNQEAKDSFLKSLTSTGEFSEGRFNTIGPSVGQELRTKSLLAMILVAIAIILFVAFAFRSVSQSVSSWKYGVVVLAVLFHDILIPAGFFAWSGIQVDTLFVVGILTILGVSVNDTIVVFDRIRENLKKFYHGKNSIPFSEIVGKSISETFTRSIMTSATVLLALLALVLVGPETTRNLSITMFLGMLFGTYSSIFVAAPLLVVWNNYSEKRKEAKK
jgi:preprotein translocase subunit SecF